MYEKQRNKKANQHLSVYCTGNITSEVLEECLEVSLEFLKQYPEDIYRDYVLAPRAANGMLRRDRKWIQKYFAGKGTDHPKKL